MRDLYECTCGTRVELIWNNDERDILLAINHQGVHTKKPGHCLGAMKERGAGQ